jgi:hypothetical protein
VCANALYGSVLAAGFDTKRTRFRAQKEVLVKLAGHVIIEKQKKL